MTKKKNFVTTRTSKDLRALAYTLAVKNGKQHFFNSEKQEAGKDWVQETSGIYNFCGDVLVLVANICPNDGVPKKENGANVECCSWSLGCL
nr:unnamed protein product [Callosobruchus analis]